MKDYWIIIRVVLALIAIFAMGVWVGRTSMPLSEKGEVGTAISKRDDLPRMGKRVMTRYHEKLQFSDEQLETVRLMFVAVTRRMEILPKSSLARLAVLEDFHEELAQILTEEQRIVADQILEESRATERR